MRRGEVWWVNFDPSVGGEIKKQRPAVIISNDSSNKYLNRLQVVPLSTQIGHIYPSEALIMLNGRPGKAMADQLTTVSKLRLSNRAGKLTENDMSEVEQIVLLQLGFHKLVN